MIFSECGGEQSITSPLIDPLVSSTTQQNIFIFYFLNDEGNGLQGVLLIFDLNRRENEKQVKNVSKYNVRSGS